MRNSTNNITTLKFNQNKKDLIQTILPTEEEFKKEAWKLKEEQEIKLTVALNQLSVKYGYKSFNAIKPELYKKLIWSPNIKNSENEYESNSSRMLFRVYTQK